MTASKPTAFSPLGQLLGIAHRKMEVKFDHFKQRFSPRKLIPNNVKSLGDYFLLKRIEANLSQSELAVKSGITVGEVATPKARLPIFSA